MKIIVTLAVAAVLTATNVNAQEVTPYFTTDEMPNLIKCLPAPPDTVGPEFYYDIMQYMWGKEQRLNAEREAIARIYRLDGTLVNNDAYGIVIEEGLKKVK